MKIRAESALAAWAVGTAWLVLFFILEQLDARIGEELVDWLQAASLIAVAALYPLFRKWFAAWLAKQCGAPER